MKKIFIVVLTALCFTACSIGDDGELPELPPVVFNEICFGSGDDVFEVAGAVNSDVLRISQDVYETELTLLSADYDLDNGAIVGSGPILFMKFYGNLNVVLQNGTYSIGTTSELGNVTMEFSEAFDTSSPVNASLIINDGVVSVRNQSTGYIVEINGLDTEGNRFHGIFAGNSTQI